MNMAVTEKTYRRAELASLVGLLLQVVGAVVVLLLAMATGAPAVNAITWYWIGGIPVWVLLLLVFHQKRLETLELLELEELRRQRDATGQSALFEVEAEDLLVAGRRLRTILRYVVPIATVILALYHVVIGGLLWKLASRDAPLNAEEIREIPNVLPAMALLGAVSFGAFVLSQMVMGLAKEPACRMLRAGGNYLTGNCFATILVVVVLAISYFGFGWPAYLLAYVIPVLLIVLGVEMVLSLILEMYRPRVPGSEPRPAIESRLLGLISEPGDMARSIAEAMNYQFGFEISRTWFYQLLQKALGPLIIFQLLALMALSMLIVVEPGERAVIERFGQFRGKGFGPGLHVKWPWPVEQVQIVSTDEIRQVLLGTDTHNGGFHDDEEVVLWTHEHSTHGHEYDILVAPPYYARFIRASSTQPTAEGGDQQDRSVSVHLLRVVAVLRYRVTDPVQYLYNYAEPGEVLRDSVQEAFLRFAASRDSDQLMTAQREQVNKELFTELQQRIRVMQPALGVELVDANLIGVHPPPAVAESYEAVGGAQLQYQQAVRWARGVANQYLATAAGSVWRAQQLAEAIEELPPAVLTGEAGADGEAQVVDRRLAELLAGAGGEVARTVSTAEAERTEIENRGLANVASYAARLEGYRLAPQLYTSAEYLSTLAQVLGPARKYLMVSPTQGQRFIVEFEMKDQAGLFDMAPTDARTGR